MSASIGGDVATIRHKRAESCRAILYVELEQALQEGETSDLTGKAMTKCGTQRLSELFEGDRCTLKAVLSREMFDGFESIIRDREAPRYGQTKFMSIAATDIVAAEMHGKTARITVSFASQLISATRDCTGSVIHGSADKVTEATDVWTFTRDISSRGPNWMFVATEAG